MNPKILLVDDDANVLKGYVRRLRKRFDVETALCSEEGLMALNFLGPFAVVVSDMTMPRTNGAEFLAKLDSVAPESVRIMLTGNADQQTAVTAVNRANVYRFLLKPCTGDQLELAVDQAVQEYGQRVGDRQRREDAEQAVLDTLVRLLELSNQAAAGRSARLSKLIEELIEGDSSYDGALLGEAASLAPLAALVPSVSPPFGAVVDVLNRAPSLHRAAKTLSSISADGRCLRGAGRDPELFSVALEFDRMTNELQIDSAEAWRRLSDASPPLPHHAVEAFQRWISIREARSVIKAMVDQLADGMVLVDDVRTTDGTMLIARGQEVTPKLRLLLDKYATTHSLCEPIAVLATTEQATAIQSLVLT